MVKEKKDIEKKKENTMSKEKKTTILLTCILGFVALVLIGFLVFEALKDNGVIVTGESKTTLDSFNEYYNSKERTVIYFASSECGWCKLQTPILETIAEDYDMDYLYIDNAKLEKSPRETIIKKLGINGATPTTVIVENGEVIDVAQGFHDGRDYVEFLSSNGVIPEDAVYSKDNNLTYVSYAEYEKLISDKKTKIIVIGQVSCSHCANMKPALNSIVEEYNLTIYYINIDMLSQADSEAFDKSLKKIKYENDLGTPLVLIFKKGKLSNYIEGEQSKSKLVKEFKKNGLISE